MPKLSELVHCRKQFVSSEWGVVTVVGLLGVKVQGSSFGRRSKGVVLASVFLLVQELLIDSLSPPVPSIPGYCVSAAMGIR